ncbi:MAG TPA: STAS domain-containing protein [Herpetosiphonaceae bacterium]
MPDLLDRILAVASDDATTRRRGRNLITITLALVAIDALFIPITLFQSTARAALAITTIAAAVFGAVIWLARRGHVAAGAGALLATVTLSLIGGIFSRRGLSVAAFFFVLPVLIASLTLRPRWIWLTVAICEISLLAGYQRFPANPFTDPAVANFAFGSLTLPIIVALIGHLGAASTDRALGAAQAAERRAAEAAGALEHANASLEATVRERTAELETALADASAQAAAQGRLLGEIEQQRATIRTLGVPVIPVSADTLVMPLVGELDSERLRELQEQALSHIEHERASQLILDITGVPVVDQAVAAGLLRVVEAGRLLGTQVILAGIRPEVAQALVSLDLRLGEIATASTLQEALGQLNARSAGRR